MRIWLAWVWLCISLPRIQLVGGCGRGNILCSSTFRYVLVLSGGLAYRSECMLLARCLSWSSSPRAHSVRDTDAIWKLTSNSYWGFMGKEKMRTRLGWLLASPSLSWKVSRGWQEATMNVRENGKKKGIKHTFWWKSCWHQSLELSLSQGVSLPLPTHHWS